MGQVLCECEAAVLNNSLCFHQPDVLARTEAGGRGYFSNSSAKFSLRCGCRAGKKLWLWRRFWEDFQKHSLAVIHCAAVYMGKLRIHPGQQLCLACLHQPRHCLLLLTGRVSTRVANVGGSRAGGIKQGQVGQEVLRAAGQMFIQSHPTHP